MAMVPLLPNLLHMVCNISWRITTLSPIYRPRTKLVYVGEMRSGRTTFNLWTMAFVLILQVTLQSLIGRNCVTRSGFSTLGMRVRWVSVIASGIFSPLRIFSTPSLTLFPTRPQYFWKKRAWYPFGTRALKGFILNGASLISRDEKVQQGQKVGPCLGGEPAKHPEGRLLCITEYDESVNKEAKYSKTMFFTSSGSVIHSSLLLLRDSIMLRLRLMMVLRWKYWLLRTSSQMASIQDFWNHKVSIWLRIVLSSSQIFASIMSRWFPPLQLVCVGCLPIWPKLFFFI